MANQVLLDSQLRLMYEAGVDEKGETIFKSKNYNNVKITSTADELLQVAQAIASLQTQTLATVERNNSNQLLA
ncbi:DUF1659 domain-containing protein [Bacillus weihaiensis]|uniref:DUF1659 domain-containing protein n=1 Tax=Bacillus weihaiensis TaxID=1547283 RepID=A0A1L3MMF1_9BACI|nr:DUF1659 domain-containing protein [Bacillus weihaiensis]APH03523.1 hypothetical protein A9C19_01445 [Bacillus weihaiensis]